MNATLKALSALLTYPTAQLQQAANDMSDVINAEPGISTGEKRALLSLMAELEEGDLLELQERYVSLFDRGRATSLNLFEHVHGDSRDRGPAMVDLTRMYNDAGLSLDANELPDYLPVVLEFLSTQPRSRVDEMLADCEHILRSLGNALRRMNSRYDAVPEAMLKLIGASGLSETTNESATVRIDTIDNEEADETWMDAPVIFGPGGEPKCDSARIKPDVIRFIPRQD